MKTGPCGCVVTVDEKWGVTRSVTKCQFHQDTHSGRRTSRENYEDMHAILDGVPQNQRLICEMEAALKELHFSWPWDPWRKYALEIGCGIGLYVPWFLRQGFRYLGIEPDVWAARFAAMNHGVPVFESTLETMPVRPAADCVMAAHVLEHLPSAPGALEWIYSALNPGGAAIVLIPDDSDLWNPDHLWFFNEGSFRDVLHRVGFVEVRTLVKQIIKKEKFIYATARKPS